MAATTTANQAIFNRLAAMPRFNPSSGSFFADWTLDPGDIVTVQQDGKDYSVPIFQMNVDWKGKSMVEVQSTGSEKRPPLSALKRNSYGGSRAAAKQDELEQQMVVYALDIQKSDERLSILATEDEWSYLKGEYQRTSTTQIDITAKGLSSIVTGVEAGNFNKNQAYAIGNIVVRNGKIYKFIAPHVAGTDWDFDEVQEAWNIYGSMAQHQTQIIQTADRVGMVVDVNGIRAGKIMLAINGGTGHSEAYIEAAKVMIGSTSGGAAITLGDKVEVLGDMTIDQGTLFVNDSVHVAEQLTIGYDGTYITTSGDFVGNSVSAAEYVQTASLTLGETNMGGCYVGVTQSTSGNQITLSFAKADGSTPDEVTFNKGSTIEMGGAWSGSVYTVSASPNDNWQIGFGSYGDHDEDLEIVCGTPSLSQSAYSADIPLILRELTGAQSQPATVYTRSSYTVSMLGLLKSMTGNDKIQYNGTYYPSTYDKLGFTAVEVDVAGGGVDPSAADVISVTTDSVSCTGGTVTATLDIEIGSNGTVWNTGTGTVEVWVSPWLDVGVEVEPTAGGTIVYPGQNMLGLGDVTVKPITVGNRSTDRPAGRSLLKTASLNGYYNVGADGYIQVSVSGAESRTVRTLTVDPSDRGTWNVGPSNYTVNVDVEYDDRSASDSTITIPLVTTYNTSTGKYDIQVAGISGATITPTAAFNDGFDHGVDSITGDNITLSGDNSSTSDSEPSASLTWSGGALNGYIWAERSDETWENLRPFRVALPAAATDWRVVVAGSNYICYCKVGGKEYSGTVSR